ncbi:MAG TPA: hypothetical protein VF744_00995 [Beijerinckiaceae bacterium]|jgi:hypothetical protein
MAKQASKTPNEAALWAAHAATAAAAFDFWNRFLGLRMGPQNAALLDDAAVQAFGKIIRAVSWVESKHGTAGVNQPRRDPMQCGNPNDIYWRELNGLTPQEDIFVRGPGLPNLKASKLPPAAESDPAFPAAAEMTTLSEPRKGHRGADYTPAHSFYWAIPYLIHRTNITAHARTFQCGDVSRQRLVNGAVAYNGGGDPHYREKIEDALELIGDIEPFLDAAPQALATARSGPSGGPADLGEMARALIKELTSTVFSDGASQAMFPGGIGSVRVSMRSGDPGNPGVSAELEILGHPAGAVAAGGQAASDAGAAEPDFHEDDPDAPEIEASSALAAAAREPSGRDWVSRFPGSRSTTDLVHGFRDGVEKFIRSMSNGGATIRINATFRPPERAYLMHFAFRIARENLDPRSVPAKDGVNIEWVHRNSAGGVDLPASRRAAEDMVQAYGMSVRAALRSRHTERRAIDMTISWTGNLTLTDGNGQQVTINTSPRSGGNTTLHRVGRTFGVIKLVSDPPHWSDDGH